AILDKKFKKSQPNASEGAGKTDRKKGSQQKSGQKQNDSSGSDKRQQGQRKGQNSNKGKNQNKNRNQKPQNKGKKQNAQKSAQKQKELPKEFTYKEGITVGELAEKIGVEASQIVKDLFLVGVVTNINQALNNDSVELIASDYGFTAEQEVVVDDTD